MKKTIDFPLATMEDINKLNEDLGDKADKTETDSLMDALKKVIPNIENQDNIKFLGLKYLSDSQLDKVSDIFKADTDTMYAFLRNYNGNSLIIGYCYGGDNQDVWGAQLKLDFSLGLSFRRLNAGVWDNWTRLDDNRDKTIINDINYDANLSREYQLKYGKSYLVTCFAYNSNNVVQYNNKSVYIVHTGYGYGTTGDIIVLHEVSSSVKQELTIGTDAILTIKTGYQYMHYSITEL